MLGEGHRGHREKQVRDASIPQSVTPSGARRRRCVRAWHGRCFRGKPSNQATRVKRPCSSLWAAASAVVLTPGELAIFSLRFHLGLTALISRSISGRFSLAYDFASAWLRFACTCIDGFASKEAAFLYLPLREHEKARGRSTGIVARRAFVAGVLKRLPTRVDADGSCARVRWSAVDATRRHLEARPAASSVTGC
jgi:hypothetical protein